MSNAQVDGVAPLQGAKVAGVTIRPYELERDADAVSRIVGEIWGGGGAALVQARFGQIGGQPWQYWMARQVLNDLKAAEAHSFVVELQGQVIGFCSYTLDVERSRGTVGFNGVDHAHQSLGLGSAMLKFVLERIRAAGMEYAGVIVQENEAHEPAKRMYVRQGFEILSTFHYMIQKFPPQS